MQTTTNVFSFFHIYLTALFGGASPSSSRWQTGNQRRSSSNNRSISGSYDVDASRTIPEQEGAKTEAASASWIATPSNVHQRSDQASSAERLSKRETSCTLYFANNLTSVRAVSFQRPPTSAASLEGEHASS